MPAFHSRRAVLAGVLGGLLAACGPMGGAVTPGRPRAVASRSGPAPHPVSPFAAAGPVELVWAADGGADPLLRPAGLAVDRRGALTVVDAGHDRLVHFTGSGEPVAALGSGGDAPGQFRFLAAPDPYPGAIGQAGGGVAIGEDGALYVADRFNARVQQLDPAGRVAVVWGPPSAAGPLLEPAAIAVDDRRGRVYVGDVAAHRVHAFDRDGRWRLAWGGPGRALGEFLRPAAVAVGRGGRVVVADGGNDRVQVFDEGGRPVAAWDLRGRHALEFPSPLGVAADGEGRVYVASASGVDVFTEAGIWLAGWDGGDDGGDRFIPNGLAVDGRGDIYVTDLGRSRVLRFRPRGPWPTPVALPASRPATATTAAAPPAPSSTPLPRPIRATPTDH